MTASGKDMQAVADMLTALKSPEMRRILGRILRMSGYFGISYVAGDTHGSAFNEGRRSMGYEVKRAIEAADPEAVVRMQLEWRNDA